MLTFGVIGAGHIGKRHIAMVNADPETCLAAVCDVRSREACGVNNDVPFYSTLAEMLNRHPEIDIVSVCTPNGYHAEMAIEILDAGRSVLMEKPMALTVADAERVREAERNSKGRFLMVFQNRYTPTSAWLKQTLDSGIMGRIVAVEVHCAWNRDSRYYKPGHWHGTADLDGGTLYTQYSHFLDLLNWYVGPIQIVDAQFADACHQDVTDFEDTGSIIFRCKDNALGTFLYTTATAMHNYECAITILGTRGTIRVGGEYMNEVQVCDIEGYTLPEIPAGNPPNDYGEYKGSAANHCYVIRDAAEVLLHGKEPAVRWEDGYENTRIIDEIYRLRKENYTSSKKLTYRP